MTTCETCGNPFAEDRPQCPYCGMHREFRGQDRPRRQLVRTKSLKDDLPLVQVALERLQAELEAARRDRVRLLKLVHGYGSSGRGGAIRVAVRQALAREKAQGRVKAVIAGEEAVVRREEFTSVLREQPQLKEDPDLHRANEGITIVIF